MSYLWRRFDCRCRPGKQLPSREPRDDGRRVGDRGLTRQGDGVPGRGVLVPADRHLLRRDWNQKAGVALMGDSEYRIN